MIDILHGDCRETLRTLADKSVQTVVTSPPYWGLRDYATAKWVGGTNPECDHNELRNDNNEKSMENNGYRGCAKCGARRIDKQIGLEATPEEYVQNMVEVFREVMRVLRNDGTLWLILGDTYASFRDSKCVPQTLGGGQRSMPTSGAANRSATAFAESNIKNKDLVGVPWRVAFALQSAGWWLRSDIIWHKPNPMPESVTDRPTKAHEYIFLFTKSARYFYDSEAISEQSVRAGETVIVTDRRNKRSVWTVNTKPYSAAHFATFPAALITPCILAGSRPGDIVLDPFAGSGTTGQVAVETGRRAVLCELSEKYIGLIKTRTTTTIGLGL